MPTSPQEPAPDTEVLTVLLEETARVLDQPPGRLGPHQHLQHDLGLDSVMLLQLKGRLETRLPKVRDVSLPDLLVGDHTLGALAGRLERVTGLPVA
ncbi:hypothetical protein GTW43_22350 [Streptomyces sp. SID5785]|uniref:acyl carrier protein n=1 Tax=Streptomyces sp. SID5785 TaxID=2690309 RepID=UPI0013613362|nr:acyl carrier protein [Streptomyces sp. SID5785]MZD07801.1 hypothetical protein [Streptomyces sp. SID5785]